MADKEKVEVVKEPICLEDLKEELDIQSGHIDAINYALGAVNSLLDACDAGGEQNAQALRAAFANSLMIAVQNARKLTNDLNVLRLNIIRKGVESCFPWDAADAPESEEKKAEDKE